MTQNIFTIPSSLSFSDTLAKILLARHQDNLSTLSKTLLLLPTRRACRVMQDAFLRQTNGKPILLPQLKPIGDIDEEELLIQNQSDLTINIPPAIAPLKRQILLTRLIASMPVVAKTMEQNMALAQALGVLLDQIHTENLKLEDLPTLVDKEAFADHWQITVDFLEILSVHWPKILKDKGCIDAADRRNRLILALTHQWQNNPPTYPVIAAGSTGSIFATKSLLKTIQSLPKGEIILPGLDTHLSDVAWHDIEEGHPQATLKSLIESLNVQRKDIKIIKKDNGSVERERIFSDVMTPASHTSQWGKNPYEGEINELLPKPIHRYDVENVQEEADLIALILRETLETPQKTAALITPSRDLARRVACACLQWGIEIDDSAGQPLSETPLGIYIVSSLEALENQCRPYAFLSLLKNDFSKGGDVKNYRQNVRLLEYQAMRGSFELPAFDCYKSRTKNSSLKSFIDHLKSIFSAPLKYFDNNLHPFEEFLTAHLNFSEKLASDSQISGAETLWKGESGEVAAQFFSDLKMYASQFPEMRGTDYLVVIKQLLSQVTVRPKYGTHPRLQILGQLEARLIQADRVILAGLNEGIWPPAIGYSPWMSRPMRKDFGLPPLERDLTLAAHDFIQGVCQKEVFITRSKKIDGTPTLPARWLERLETYIQATPPYKDFVITGPHLAYLKALHKSGKQTPICRPSPKPPVDARPRQLSVTRIETLMKDPYAIYAGKILGLYKLEPLEKDFDAAQRGTVIHNTLNRFVQCYTDILSNNALDDFLTIAKEEFAKELGGPEAYAFYAPRLIRLGSWFINQDRKWRQTARFGKSELKGSVTLDNGFTLEARADRIDRLNRGGAAIIDYKTGGTYSKKQMQNGGLPQLGLEALILDESGFDGFTGQTDEISYWKLTGGNPAGEVITVDNMIETQLTETVKSNLTHLIDVFQDKETPYHAIPILDNAPRFNDYEHLERVKEWAALDGESEAAA